MKNGLKSSHEAPQSDIVAIFLRLRLQSQETETLTLIFVCMTEMLLKAHYLLH